MPDHIAHHPRGQVVGWDAVDGHRMLTWLALAGLGTGVVLAVVGLPPVGLHGPLHYAGIMGPTCGGTRALRQMLLGNWAMAWTYNPLSVVLAAGAALTLVRHIAGVLTGCWLTVRLRFGRATWILIALALAVLTVNQQLHVELLTQTR